MSIGTYSVTNKEQTFNANSPRKKDKNTKDLKMLLVLLKIPSLQKTQLLPLSLFFHIFYQEYYAYISYSPFLLYFLYFLRLWRQNMKRIKIKNKRPTDTFFLFCRFLFSSIFPVFSLPQPRRKLCCK